jgi:hypothetical protein
MPNESSAVDQSQAVEFGAVEFKAMATVYKADKAIVNAASKYDSLDDAVAALTKAWNAIDEAGQAGAGYTPSTDLGFGSDNTLIVTEKILGRATGIGATRKALSDHGS